MHLCIMKKIKKLEQRLTGSPGGPDGPTNCKKEQHYYIMLQQFFLNHIKTIQKYRKKL